ncbi:HD domain-containing protein [Bacillus pumilus]|uniref:HD domain-containing protein n=1 Tax=Bacillus pumilus TaxID=1408 RepID=UPI001C225271|nr:HD domain-containing protein [Bacillus pumilus]MBU8607708.1 HD domain-containing protein [Bacillus pumilus]MED1109933.1 HD domain-containing protein [Bacillus pumilus]
MQKKQLEAAASFVSDRLKYEPTGHDAAHIDRVRQLARQIANQEGGSLFVIEMAAIVHDIIDEKLSSECKLSPQQLEHQLLFWEVNTRDIRYIMDIITTMSFRHRHKQNRPITLEGAIVQDADRLDAIGATGIARVFTYAGAKGEPHYSKDTQQGSVLKHMEEKLLKLKDLMNTHAGTQLAEDRHDLMSLFIKTWKEECGLTDE